MYRVAHETGRFVEIAIWSPVSIEGAERWGEEHDAVVAGVGEPYVCFVDLRGAKVFPPKVAEAYVAVMKAEQELLRTGTLLPGSSMVAMQIGRLIREAGHPQRQAFDDPDELSAWLGELMGPLERARLRSLLESPPYPVR